MIIYDLIYNPSKTKLLKNGEKVGAKIKKWIYNALFSMFREFKNLDWRNFMIKLTTSGESHGKYFVRILEGIPSNLKLDIEKVRFNLNLRRKGYVRSERMEIEDDSFEILEELQKILLQMEHQLDFLLSIETMK